MATIFTRIIRGEIPSYKVAEDDRFYAFLDIAPLVIGHTLVVPKFEPSLNGTAITAPGTVSVPIISGTAPLELDYIFDLDDDTLAAMMIFAKRVAARIREVTGCARVAVAVLGLEVPHVHIHLIPIDHEADVDFRKPRLKLSPEEFSSLSAKLSV